VSGRVLLPLPEPPDPAVEEVLHALRIAREQHAGARERLLRVDQMRQRGVQLGQRDSMTLRVIHAARTHEVELWDAEIDGLLARARELGVQP
jgi:hypothetical protein